MRGPIDWLEVAVALLKLFFLNISLVYYWLPRGWRGGFRSPWLLKAAERG